MLTQFHIYIYINKMNIYIDFIYIYIKSQATEKLQVKNKEHIFKTFESKLLTWYSLNKQ